MEYETVIISVGVFFICILAFFGSNGLVTFYNTNYGTTVAQDANMVASLNHINNATGSFYNTGLDMGTGLEGTEGAGETDKQQGLITKSLNIIITIKEVLGLAPSAIGDANTAIGGGAEQYVTIAKTIFVIVFAIIFGYLLLVGARKI